MWKGFLIYDEMRKYLVIYGDSMLVIYDFAQNPLLNSLIYEENFVFFLSVWTVVEGTHFNTFKLVRRFKRVMRKTAARQAGVNRKGQLDKQRF
jgi:hypothetical protein